MRPDTYNWHFVDIPIHSDNYQSSRDCKADVKGDFVVNELTRLQNDLRCTSGAQQVEALKFTVHFVGDIHQPVLEARGGNNIPVTLLMRGRKSCTGECKPVPVRTNFHAAWDNGLILQTVWDWGAYVDLLNGGLLKSTEAKQPDIDGGKPADWAIETHKAAQKIWNLRPSGEPLDDDYYNQVAPILDRQLGIAGLRLARFLKMRAPEVIALGRTPAIVLDVDEKPPQIHAMDLATGSELWSHSVRDTTDRRPRPP
jgi:hypothetical protein